MSHNSPNDILNVMEEVKVKEESKPEGDKNLEVDKPHLLKKFPKKVGKHKFSLVIGTLLVVLAGVGTGWMISGSSLERGGVPADVAPGAETSLTEAGIADEETFRDSAEGVLVEGGIDGEGTHHLVREGGPAKYAYLTSTVIDMHHFVYKKFKVWGETISAKTAGWLMDVGKIKVIE